MEKNPAFVIDFSVLKGMIDGTGEKSQDLVDKLYEIQNKGNITFCFTTMSSLFKAILDVKPDTKIENLQKILKFIKVVPVENNNHNSEKKMMEEIVKLAKMVNKGKSDGA